MSDQNPGAAPIVVNQNPAQDSVEALVRQVILVVAGIASALGYAGVAGKASAVLLASGPIAALIVMIIGQVKTFRLAKAALPQTPVQTKVGWLR